MANITRTVKTDYKNKGISVVNGKFVNTDGEIIDIAAELESVFGGEIFDLSVSVSSKEDITPSVED